MMRSAGRSQTQPSPFVPTGFNPLVCICRSLEAAMAVREPTSRHAPRPALIATPQQLRCSRPLRIIRADLWYKALGRLEHLVVPGVPAGASPRSIPGPAAPRGTWRQASRLGTMMVQEYNILYV